MNFAKEQLSKHGWTEGQGLGRTENGITEAIKVKIKQNKTGVGHDPGEEFSFHWWDHVFNKAASKIKVKTTDTGVEIKNEGDTKVSKKKDSKTYCNKSMLYGQFVKGATLSDGTETQEDQQAAPSEDEETTETVQCLMPDQADTVFKMCGGRTAHKGARHGLKLNGKLQRIEEQERLLLEKYNAARNISDVKKGENADCSVDITNAEETSVKKRSKKDKKSKRDRENKEKESQLQNVDSGISLDIMEDSKTEVELDNDNVVDIAEKSSKKDKKMKRKRNEENENVENGLDSKTEEAVEAVAKDDGETKVKSKKRKKNKKNKEGDYENSVGDENSVNVTSNNTAEAVVEEVHCDGDVVDSDKKRKKNKKKKRDNSSTSID